MGGLERTLALPLWARGLVSGLGWVRGWMPITWEAQGALQLAASRPDSLPARPCMVALVGNCHDLCLVRFDVCVGGPDP